MLPCPQDEWVLTKGSKRAHFSPECCWRVPWWLLDFWKGRIRNTNSKYCRFFLFLSPALLSRFFVFGMTEPPRPPSVVDNSIESLKVMNMRMWRQGGSNVSDLRWLLLMSNRAAKRDFSTLWYWPKCVCSALLKLSSADSCQRIRFLLTFSELRHFCKYSKVLVWLLVFRQDLTLNRSYVNIRKYL